jgi:peptidase E
MKTTLLLHGGRLKIKDKRNDDYFRTLTKGLAGGDTLLHIPFARRTAEEQREVFDREKILILAQTNKKITVVMATKENLIDQIERSQAIHITGGESPELIRDVRRYPDFLSSLRGKTVGGSSAGACLFSECYWYGEQNKGLKGLGTLPIALFVHYGSEKFHATDEELEIFRPYTEGLELLILEEAEWVARTVEL